MARHDDDLRDRQSLPFKNAVAVAGLSHEILAARMGVTHIKFRKVVNGHERATPWFIARFLVAVSDTPALTDPIHRHSLLIDLIGGAAWFEHGCGMNHEPSVWKRRPEPWAPPCEVRDDG